MSYRYIKYRLYLSNTYSFQFVALGEILQNTPQYELESPSTIYKKLVFWILKCTNYFLIN